MSWSAPRTWVAAEVVTAALMNADIRDNFLATFGSDGILDRSTTALSANVAMPLPDTYYDGPTLTPGAGTYFLSGGVQVGTTGAAESNVTAKLWDGTTGTGAEIASGEDRLYGSICHIHLSGYGITDGTKTFRISVAGTDGDASIKAATPQNNPGNTASYLQAIRIGSTS